MNGETPKALARLSRLRTLPPRWRPAALGVAAALFVVGVVLSLDDLDVSIAQVRWWPLVVIALAGTPATIVANAAELRAMARCLDVEMPWAEAIRTVVLATAANVLPLPGAALVRLHALNAVGATLARAGGVNLVAAGVWVAAALSVAGVAAFGFNAVVGGVAFAGGVVGIAVCAVLMRTVTSRRPRGYVGLVAVEVTTTLLHAARLWLALVAVGVGAGFAQAVVLGASAPLAAAAGVFPSGLGLAELIAALLAPVVALQASAGFAATAVSRVVGLVATAPLAVALGVLSARDGARCPGTSRSDRG